MILYKLHNAHYEGRQRFPIRTFLSWPGKFLIKLEGEIIHLPFLMQPEVEAHNSLMAPSCFV